MLYACSFKPCSSEKIHHTTKLICPCSLNLAVCLSTFEKPIWKCFLHQNSTMLKKKKSYLVGLCLFERSVMLKTLFSPGTATLSQTLQGSHIRGNVIHSLALHSSFLHLSPNELPLNYHFTSTLPFYDSICLSISDFLPRLPRARARTGSLILLATVSERRVEAFGSSHKPPPPTPETHLHPCL